MVHCTPLCNIPRCLCSVPKYASAVDKCEYQALLDCTKTNWSADGHAWCNSFLQADIYHKGGGVVIQRTLHWYQYQHPSVVRNTKRTHTARAKHCTVSFNIACSWKPYITSSCSTHASIVLAHWLVTFHNPLWELLMEVHVFTKRWRKILLFSYLLGKGITSEPGSNHRSCYDVAYVQHLVQHHKWAITTNNHSFVSTSRGTWHAHAPFQWIDCKWKGWRQEAYTLSILYPKVIHCKRVAQRCGVSLEVGCKHLWLGYAIDFLVKVNTSPIADTAEEV